MLDLPPCFQKLHNVWLCNVVMCFTKVCTFWSLTSCLMSAVRPETDWSKIFIDLWWILWCSCLQLHNCCFFFFFSSEGACYPAEKNRRLSQSVCRPHSSVPKSFFDSLWRGLCTSAKSHAIRMSWYLTWIIQFILFVIYCHRNLQIYLYAFSRLKQHCVYWKPRCVCICLYQGIIHPWLSCLCTKHAFHLVILWYSYPLFLDWRMLQ